MRRRPKAFSIQNYLLMKLQEENGFTLIKIEIVLSSIEWRKKTAVPLRERSNEDVDKD